MTQSRRHSAIETVCGVAAGFALSLAASPIVYPLFGHAFTFTQNVGITIVFTVLSLVRGYAVRRAGNWWQQRKAKPDPLPFNHNPRPTGERPEPPPGPPPQYDPADVAFKKPDGWRWFSLPGGRMELADTGFYITLNPSEPGKVYQGFTPEGYRLTWGNDLAQMKRYLEGEARERAEFEPPKGGWQA